MVYRGVLVETHDFPATRTLLHLSSTTLKNLWTYSVLEARRDHKILLHACRNHLCVDRASAIAADLMEWSVTLNAS